VGELRPFLGKVGEKKKKEKFKQTKIAKTTAEVTSRYQIHFESDTRRRKGAPGVTNSSEKGGGEKVSSRART